MVSCAPGPVNEDWTAPVGLGQNPLVRRIEARAASARTGGHKALSYTRSDRPSARAAVRRTPPFPPCGYCGTPLAAPRAAPRDSQDRHRPLHRPEGLDEPGRAARPRVAARAHRRATSRHAGDARAPRRHRREVHRRRDHGRVRPAAVHEDDALRAVRAAAGCGRRSATSTRSSRPLGRPPAHAHRREHRRGRGGRPRRGQRLVTGDAVNVAARLEQAATADESCSASSPTARARRGRGRPGRAARAQGQGRARPRLPAAGGRGGAPALPAPATPRSWAARSELGVLPARSRGRRPSALPRSSRSSATPGVGKSRLTAGVRRPRRRRRAVLAAAACRTARASRSGPSARSSAAAGIRRTMRRTRARKLARWSGDADEVADACLGVGLASSLPGRGDLLGRAQAHRGARGASGPSSSSSTTSTGPSRRSSTSSSTSPIGASAVILVCAARARAARAAAGLGGERRRHASRSSRSGEETRALVEASSAAAGSRSMPSGSSLAAEGNPLFVEQFLSMLVDDGLVRSEATRWRAAGELGDLVAAADDPGAARGPPRPPGRDERAVIEAAAVVG